MLLRKVSFGHHYIVSGKECQEFQLTWIHLCRPVSARSPRELPYLGINKWRIPWQQISTRTSRGRIISWDLGCHIVNNNGCWWLIFRFRIRICFFFIGNVGPMPRSKEIFQLQQTVKSLEERLAAQNSKSEPEKNERTQKKQGKTYRRIRERRHGRHELSESGDDLEDISSDEFSFHSGSEEEERQEIGDSGMWTEYKAEKNVWIKQVNRKINLHSLSHPLQILTNFTSWLKNLNVRICVVRK